MTYTQAQIDKANAVDLENFSGHRAKRWCAAEKNAAGKPTTA